jgi:class 3 adenylate cyclase/TolB-like protein
MRRPAVVLVVDMVESVRLEEEDEDGTLLRWQAFLAHVKNRILARYSGRVVKSLGDGLLLEFNDVRSAFGAATAMHEWLADDCPPLEDGSRIEIRAGIHATEVMDTPDDIMGKGVNLAARVATLANGGETIATVGARDLLTDELDADIEDLGECFLKHLDYPVRAYRLGPARHPTALPATHSYGEQTWLRLALIPFTEARAPAAAHSALSDVIADALIYRLAMAPGLRVVSRLSTAALRDTFATPQAMAAMLGVRYLVSGSFFVSGESIVIFTQLIDARSGETIWGGQTSGRWQDLLCVDSEIVLEISSAVHRELQEEVLSRATTHPLPLLSSYELFLGGIAMMHRASASGFEKSRRWLEELTERHRRIAAPHAWLGKWHVLRTIQGTEDDSAQAAELALRHTGRALELEPDSALALAIEGFVYCHLRKDLDTAESRLRLACEIGPSEGFSWLFLGVLHAFKGDGESAVSEATQAVALSPIDPLRYYYESLMGSCLYAAERYPEAVDWCERSLRRNRRHLSTLRVLIAAHAAIDHGERVQALGEELRRQHPQYTVAKYEQRSVAALYPFGQRIAEALRTAGVP